MRRLVEFRFSYALEVIDVPSLPGIDVLLINPAKVQVVTPESEGHIEKRTGKDGALGVEWTDWKPLHRVKYGEGKRKSSAQALANRNTCSTCLAKYKDDQDAPENKLFTNWAQGGPKLFKRDL